MVGVRNIISHHQGNIGRSILVCDINKYLISCFVVLVSLQNGSDVCVWCDAFASMHSRKFFGMLLRLTSPF